MCSLCSLCSLPCKNACCQPTVLWQPILHSLTYFTFPHLFYIPSLSSLLPLHSLSLLFYITSLPLLLPIPFSPLSLSGARTACASSSYVYPTVCSCHKSPHTPHNYLHCLCLLSMCLPKCLLLSQLSQHSSQEASLLAPHVLTKLSQVTSLPTLVTTVLTVYCGSSCVFPIICSCHKSPHTHHNCLNCLYWLFMCFPNSLLMS